MTLTDVQALLERERELELLEAAVDAAQGGAGQVVFLEGPAGIGKTRLMNALRERAQARGAEILVARGGELERDFPFGVVRQLFEPLVVPASAKEQVQLFAGAARLAAPLLGHEPAHEGQATGLSAGEAPYATLHGLYWLCANLAARNPLAILVDDAHWTDAPSLRWVSYLLSRLEELPVVMGLAARSEPEATDGVLAAIASSSLAQVIRPAPLSEPAVAELIRETVGPDAAEEFCHACHEVTAGNPFMLSELLNELSASERPPSASRAAEVRALGPRGVSRAVLRRLERLPADAGALARAVAVLGARAEPHHAAALCGLDQAVANEAAGCLADAGILVAEPPLRFAHPIVRTAIYCELPVAERARSHARAARILEADGAPLDQVAAHLLATPGSGESWVIATLGRAAAGALARGTPAAAIAYLHRALAEPPGRAERPRLLADLGAAELRARHPDAVDHLSQALELTDDPHGRAVIALPLARALYMAGELAETVAVLQRSIAELGPDDQLALRLEAELISAARLDLRTRPIVADRLARFEDHVRGEGPGQRVLLANLGYEAVIRGDPAERGADLAERALGGNALLAEEGCESPTYYFAAWTLALCERFGQAARALDAALVDARERGSALGFALASCFRSNVCYRRGLLLDAEADAHHALEAPAEDGWQIGRPLAVAFLLDALTERGELEQAAGVLEALGVSEQVPDSIVFNPLLHARGRLRVLQGRHEEGLADFLACGQRGAAWGARTSAFLPLRSSAALVLATLERSEEGRRLAEEEVALARDFGMPRALGVALRAAGLVAGGEEGLGLLAEAVAVLEGSEATLERARAIVELGAALRRANRRSAARERLRAGLGLAEGCGALPLAEQARAELAATGARPRRAVRSGLEELTPSERRVAQMAAEGLGNREIAQALFVTVKTVEWHLGQTYRKLDVRSRAELPAVLA